MKRFLRKKLFKSTSSSAKQSISSLNSIGDEIHCNYPIDLSAVNSSFTKLHKGCFLGDGDKVKAALKKIDVNVRDSDGRTPLHIAAAGGHLGVVQLLLHAKSDLDLQDKEGKTPLVKAVECQHETVIRTLLNEGANPNIADSNGDTALHVALSSARPDIAIMLLQYSVDISVRNKEGMLPLHLAVLQKHQDVVELLLKKGADACAQDNEGRTPLIVACRIGCASLTSLLLKNGADPTQTDTAGWTALVHATRAGHVECQQVLATFSAQTFQAAVLSSAEDMDSWKSTESEQSEKPKKSLLPLASKVENCGSPDASDKVSQKVHEAPAVLCLKGNAGNTPKENFVVDEAATAESRKDQPENSPLDETKDYSVEAVLRKANVQRTSLAPAFEKSLDHNSTKEGQKVQPPNGREQSNEKARDVRSPNDGDDISKWFSGDTSLTESEMEEKASSLYIPSTLEERPSIFDANVHKSVEVLLAYDGQQLKGGAVLTVQNEEENVLTSSKGVKMQKQGASQSASEWDSSEGGEELSCGQHLVEVGHHGECGKMNTTQSAEEIKNDDPDIEEQGMSHYTLKKVEKEHFGMAADAPGQEQSEGFQGIPTRPPRSPSKNHLRSSWSSSTSSSPSKSQLEHRSPRRQSLIDRKIREPVGFVKKHQNEEAKKQQLSMEPFSSSSSKSSKSSLQKELLVQGSRKKSLGCVPDTGNNVSPSAKSPTSDMHVQHQTTPFATSAHRTAGRSSLEGQLIESLLNEKVLLSRQLLEASEFRKTLEARIAELEGEVEEARQYPREAEVKETIDKQLADLDLELKSAKSLIKDLQHEIESLQRQLNSYKESADMYKELNEKQEQMFKNMLAEKEKLWNEEKQRLVAELQESNIRPSEAISSSRLDDIQEVLTSLHGVLASLNTKASADKEPSPPLPEEVTSMLQISRSSWNDLQGLNSNLDQTAQLLQSISDNLHNSNDQGKAIESSLDNLQEAVGKSSRGLSSVSDTLHTVAANCGNICETLERLEANQKLLTNTLSEFQSLFCKPSQELPSPELKPRVEGQKAPKVKDTVVNHGCDWSTSDDLPELKESVTRVLNKLDSFAEEIKNMSQSKAEDVARKVADSFEEYHNITKQEMLNLLNKVSCNQEAVVKASITLSEHQRAHDAKISEEFDYLKLNQSKALEQLQSLKDELIRMDSSGMFDKLESIQNGTVGKISSMIEPVSTELKCIRASIDNNQSLSANRIIEPGEAVGAAQLRSITTRLDSVLEQTNSLQAKQKDAQSKNITVDIKGAFPYTDYSVLLSDLRAALSDLSGEIQRRHQLESKNAGHQESQFVQGSTSPVHKCADMLTNGLQSQIDFEKEKYRNKKALVKYKSELKAIKEKLKDIGQRQRGSIYDNVPVTQTEAELQRKVDLLHLRVDSDYRHQTDIEIRNLRAEVQQIQQSLPELMQQKQNFIPPNTTVPKSGEPNPPTNVDEKLTVERMELMEINRLQENLRTAQSSKEYWWLREDNERSQNATEIKTTYPQPVPRKKQVVRVQSTPQPSKASSVMRGLPTWNTSPVTAKASLGFRRTQRNTTNSARYRVQAMLEESFKRHLGNTTQDGFQGACASMTDAPIKASSPECTKAVHKADII